MNDENGSITVPTSVEGQLRACVEQIGSREKRIMDFVRCENFSLDGFTEAVAE